MLFLRNFAHLCLKTFQSGNLSFTLSVGLASWYSPEHGKQERTDCRIACLEPMSVVIGAEACKRAGSASCGGLELQGGGAGKAPANRTGQQEKKRPRASSSCRTWSCECCQGPYNRVLSLAGAKRKANAKGFRKANKATVARAKVIGGRALSRKTLITGLPREAAFSQSE